mgnify:CR=1 FL=1
MNDQTEAHYDLRDWAALIEESDAVGSNLIALGNWLGHLRQLGLETNWRDYMDAVRAGIDMANKYPEEFAKWRVLRRLVDQ